MSPIFLDLISLVKKLVRIPFGIWLNPDEIQASVGPTNVTQLSMVVCEVPEARLSVNDKTTDSDEVYFNTEVHIYTKIP